MKHLFTILATLIVSLNAFAQTAVYTSVPASPSCLNQGTWHYTAQSGHTNYAWKPNGNTGAGTVYVIQLGCGITDTFCDVQWKTQFNKTMIMSYTGATIARNINLVYAPSVPDFGGTCMNGILETSTGWTMNGDQTNYVWDLSGAGVQGVDWDFATGCSAGDINHTNFIYHNAGTYIITGTYDQTAGCGSTPVIPATCTFSEAP